MKSVVEDLKLRLEEKETIDKDASEEVIEQDSLEPKHDPKVQEKKVELCGSSSGSLREVICMP